MSPTRSSQAKAASVLGLGQGKEQVSADFFDAQFVELPQDGQIAGLVAGEIDVGGAEDEGLVALVAPVLDERRGLGIGSRHNDARHPHDVELQAGRVEALDLLVHRHQHLAALVAALLRSRLLVFDVVAGHSDLDEAADQIADMRVATVTGVGVGDDERPKVDDRCRLALFFGHPRAREVLVLVGGEKRPHQSGGLVGHLAERIAGQVGTRILGQRALGGRRPAAQVNAFHPNPLHHHRLARRIGTEGSDLPALFEEFAQPRVEILRCLPRYGVVAGKRALLLGHLARRVETDDPVEAGAREPFSRGRDLLVEHRHSGFLVLSADQHFPPPG